MNGDTGMNPHPPIPTHGINPTVAGPVATKAYYDRVNNAQLCPECGGHGTIRVKEYAGICPMCKGACFVTIAPATSDGTFKGAAVVAHSLVAHAAAAGWICPGCGHVNSYSARVFSSTTTPPIPSKCYRCGRTEPQHMHQLYKVWPS